MKNQCHAKSTTTGKQCGRPAIKGGAVCVFHGGSAPQVQAAARRRLLAMVDPALVELEKLVASTDERVKLGAVKDVLDRSGLKPTETVEQRTISYDVSQLASLTEEELAALERITAKLTADRSDPSGEAEAAEE